MEQVDTTIHKAFHRFVYDHTNWKIYQYGDGSYIGKTKERFESFKAGWLAGTAQHEHRLRACQALECSLLNDDTAVMETKE